MYLLVSLVFSAVAVARKRLFCLLCRDLLKSRLVSFTFTFMHLGDAFIQSDLHCIQITVFYILSALAFPGNRTHDLGVASAMLYYLSYRKAWSRTVSRILSVSALAWPFGVITGKCVQLNSICDLLDGFKKGYYTAAAVV